MFSPMVVIRVREYNKLPLKVHLRCGLLSIECSLDRDDGSYCEEVLLRPRARFSWNSNTSLAASLVQFSLYSTFRSSVILQSLSTVRALSSIAAVSSSRLGTAYDPPSDFEPVETSRSFAESYYRKTKIFIRYNLFKKNSESINDYINFIIYA